MLIQLQSGPTSRQITGQVTAPAGSFGELLDSRLMPDYYNLVKSGKLFTSSIAAVNPTAFTGAAAGTPVIGLFNPVGSGVDLVLVDVAVGIRTTGTAAVTVDFNHWAVNQGGIAVTGALTAPRQLYSLAATGSVTNAMQNTVNTAALASFLLRPSMSVGLTGVTATPNVQLLRDEVKGSIVIAPGCYYAFGASASTTAASIDAAIIWAEVAV
jgi:hypothetical protein